MEIFHNNEWGTVCDDIWNTNNVRVVCRELGYSNVGGTAYSSAHFGQGSGRIWLDDVDCAGDESSLGSCSHMEWGLHNCDHNEDAGASCGR